MKKGFIIVLLLSFISNAYSQNVKSRTYATGIYIYCGNELPKGFEYVIERKAEGEAEYSTIAAIQSPSSEADCKGRLMSLPNSITSNTKVEPAVIGRVWQQCNKNLWLDSLYGYALDPRYQFTAGCGWFDNDIKSGNYSYRISKKNNNDSMMMLKEERIAFPSVAYKGMAKAVRFKPEERSVIIHYALSDTLNTAGLKVYRSQHKENNFVDIPVGVSFMKVNGQTVAQVTDATAVKDVTYSYVAMPYDGLGNMGYALDTLNVYNMMKAGDIGMIQSFEVKPIEEKKGMEVSWKLKSDAGLTSLELYRSSTYGGTYRKIASVSPKETSYFDADKNIKPATNYFYYIVANASYGRSFPSARTPGILKGNRPNILPPQNVSISRKANIVTLSFLKTENDTRGYYVYRGKGYTGELKQLQRMLLTEDSALVYVDTLPLSNLPETYSYAVADVNTSYNISPMSERLSVQTSGTLPTVAGVSAMLNYGKVFVTWKDASLQNPAVGGYKLYRSAIDNTGKKVEQPTVLATITSGSNSYTDSTIKQGLRYRYQVQATGLEDDDQGSMSLWASISIANDLPMEPGHVLGYASAKNAVIKWDLPADANIAKIRIYRAVADSPSTLLVELNSTTKMYEDSKIEIGKTYYYMLASVDKNNKESILTDAVVVKLR